MKKESLRLALGLGLALGLSAAFADRPAEPLGPGDALPPMELADQHGKPQRLSAETRLVLFAPDRQGGAMIEEALAGEHQARLDALGVRVVADISAMPAMVARVFALPKMRDYPYRIMLAREPADTRSLPRSPQKVTAIAVRDGRIQRVEPLTQATEIRARIGLPAVRSGPARH